MMEKNILNLLNFDLYSPTSVSFLKLYHQILNLERKIIICSEYLADLMLLAINSHQYEPSSLASACILVSLSSLPMA